MFLKERIKNYPNYSPAFRSFGEEWLSSDLVRFSESAKSDAKTFCISDCSVVTWECPTVFSFPVLNEKFGQLVAEEMDILKGKIGAVDFPSTRDGVTLDDIGFRPFVDQLIAYLTSAFGLENAPFVLECKVANLVSRLAETNLGQCDCWLDICLNQGKPESHESGTMKILAPGKWVKKGVKYIQEGKQLKEEKRVLTELSEPDLGKYYKEYTIVHKVGNAILYSGDLQSEWSYVSTSKTAGSRRYQLILGFDVVRKHGFPQFTSLPFEIQLMVFSFLGPGDLARVSLSHPSFNTLIKAQSDTLWQPLFEEVFGGMDLSPYTSVPFFEDKEEEAIEWPTQFREKFILAAKEIRNRRELKSEHFEALTRVGRDFNQSRNCAEPRKRSRGAKTIYTPAFRRLANKRKKGACFVQ